jgi:broad specificity phosphatase PhoE
MKAPPKIIARHAKYKCGLHYAHPKFYVEGLTADGITQAERLRDSLGEVLALPDLRIIASQTLRTIETAAVLIQGTAGQTSLAAIRKILADRDMEARQSEGLADGFTIHPKKLFEALDGKLGRIEIDERLSDWVPPDVRQINGPVLIVAHYPTGLDVGLRLKDYASFAEFDPLAAPISDC